MTRARILLDTTYLLPIFGIPIQLPQFESTFSQLLGTRAVMRPIYVSNCSLLEVKWKVIHHYKKTGDESIFDDMNDGLKSIRHDHRFQVINSLDDPEIDKIAITLWLAGHSDLFDCLILATAMKNDLFFITEDKALEKFICTSRPEEHSRLWSWRKLLDVMKGNLEQ